MNTTYEVEFQKNGKFLGLTQQTTYTAKEATRQAFFEFRRVGFNKEITTLTAIARGIAGKFSGKIYKFKYYLIGGRIAKIEKEL